jgi:hypothetical protein
MGLGKVKQAIKAFSKALGTSQEVENLIINIVK